MAAGFDEAVLAKDREIAMDEAWMPFFAVYTCKSTGELHDANLDDAFCHASPLGSNPEDAGLGVLRAGLERSRLGADLPQSTAQMADYARVERAKWGAVIKAAGIQAD